MILASHGIIASQIASFDADAGAFFGRVTTAGGSLSLTEKQAVNQLVLDLKANSLWTPMKAIYPMVGASAAACAQNLKSSCFTGTFSSGWTFASGGITGNAPGFTNGNISISNCTNSGAVSGLVDGGICGASAGSTNGTISITKCVNSGIISGQNAGGITGFYFGYNSNNLCSIINSYNTGDINGNNSGGITGASVGYNYNAIYIPKILIQNCYSLGNIATTAGGICGGTGITYTNTPVVNITNCYSSYNSIADIGSQYIATSLPIKNSIILTNVYTSLTSLWSDTNANSTLSGALSIYRNSRLYKYYSNFGAVWYSNQNNTPFSFTSDLDNVPRRQIRE